MYKHRNNKGSLTVQSDQLCVSSECVVLFTADTHWCGRDATYHVKKMPSWRVGEKNRVSKKES